MPTTEGNATVKHPFSPLPRGSVRRVGPSLLCGVLALTVAGCTGGADKPAADPSPTPTTASTSTIEAQPVPLATRVTRVSGRLPAKDQQVLAANIGRTVSAYFDAAFLGGDYPRSDFSRSFSAFTAEAARQAQRQLGLLTNAGLGPTTQGVVARRQVAYLSVLAPNKVAAGATARVELQYVAQRGDQPDQEVTVKGRLMLTRKPGGGWVIFGYDLTRSARTVEEGS